VQLWWSSPSCPVRCRPFLAAAQHDLHVHRVQLANTYSTYSTKSDDKQVIRIP
jgi:hypothetical protein